jgi:hypothetical protein
MRLAIISILFALAAAAGSPAHAEQRVREFANAPFSIGAMRLIAVKLLPLESSAGFALVAKLPRDIAEIDVVEFRWPRSNQACALAIARSRPASDQPELPQRSYLAVLAAEQATLLALPEEPISGFINRVAVWPTANNDTGELVFLVSLGEGASDSRLLGFAVAPSGAVTPVSTGSAKTQFGWFDVSDLDDDGRYELITKRSLDGMEGGFMYSALRTYDPATHTYAPQPAGYHSFYERELAWLDWVVTTRDLIQANPAPYLTTGNATSVYMAAYENVKYGFDTVIEVPATFTGVPDVPAYNRARRQCFERVCNYRDELAAWLSGGALPATWKMPQ